MGGGQPVHFFGHEEDSGNGLETESDDRAVDHPDFEVAGAKQVGVETPMNKKCGKWGIGVME